MDENMTLLIDPETRDLVLDENGFFKKIFDKDTVVQNVRHALLTWKAEFFADLRHGTDYERIMGKNQNELEDGEVDEVIREAVFQEPDISWIESINITFENRKITAEISAVTVDDTQISLAVTAQWQKRLTGV